MPGTGGLPHATAVAHHPTTGAEAVLLRVGDRFAFARSRNQPCAQLPTRARLRQLPLTEVRELFDCEISMGTVAEGRWQITRSTLPYKEGRVIEPRTTGELLQLDDLAGETGAPNPQCWPVDLVIGDVEDLTAVPNR